MNPKITIVTVVRNAESTIEQTMLSVLHQTYSNIEYIVVDGASTDGTLQIIKNYELRIMNGEFPNIVSFKFISEPDEGIYDAMNKGIDMAEGEWINFMNAGDSFYEKNTIQQLFDKVNIESDIVYGDTIFVLDIGNYLQKSKPLNLIKHQMVFGHQATFIRTSLHKYLKFDKSFRSSGDYNFFYQAYKQHCIFQYIPIIVVNYNGEKGMSKDNFVRVLLEDARIHGKINKLSWKIYFMARITNIYMRIYLKKVLPKSIVFYIKKNNAIRNFK